MNHQDWLQSVRDCLQNAKTRTGGVLVYQNTDQTGVVHFEPKWRQRLDHYGNDGDGWDYDGWNDNYASPLQKEAEALLAAKCIKNCYVDIGEKGHLTVQFTTK